LPFEKFTKEDDNDFSRLSVANSPEVGLTPETISSSQERLMPGSHLSIGIKLPRRRNSLCGTDAARFNKRANERRFAITHCDHQCRYQLPWTKRYGL